MICVNKNDVNICGDSADILTEVVILNAWLLENVLRPVCEKEGTDIKEEFDSLMKIAFESLEKEKEGTENEHSN